MFVMFCITLLLIEVSLVDYVFVDVFRKNILKISMIETSQLTAWPLPQNYQC